MKKVHLYKSCLTTTNILNFASCGETTKSNRFKKFAEFEKLPEEKKCKSCLNSKFYKDLKAKKESKRPLEKGEFDEPEFKRATATDKKGYVAILKENLNIEEYIVIFDYLKSKGLKFFGNKSYPCIDVTVEDVRRGSIDFTKLKNFIDNSFKTKTQLQIDKEKYNLNDEHIKILQGVDYEIVEFIDEASNCNQCLLIDICKDFIKCDVADNKDKNIYFKQIHKTQESFNESLESDEVEEPFLATEIKREQIDIKNHIVKDCSPELFNRIKDISNDYSYGITKINLDFSNHNTLTLEYIDSEKMRNFIKDVVDKPFENMLNKIPTHPNCYDGKCVDIKIEKSDEEEPTVTLKGDDAIDFIKRRDEEVEEENEQLNDAYKETPDKYKFNISNRNGENIICDVYDIAESIRVLNTAHFHALKKVLCPGIRGAKGVKQDLTEANKSLDIAILLNEVKK